MTKGERKKQKVAEHNKLYKAKKIRLSNMSEKEIFDEQLMLSVKNAVVEIMPHARTLLQKKT
jgi:hypothetical protein